MGLLSNFPLSCADKRCSVILVAECQGGKTDGTNKVNQMAMAVILLLSCVKTPVTNFVLVCMILNHL